MMIISVEKVVSGMYASKPKTTRLDINNLDEQQQMKLQDIIKDVDFFNLPTFLSDSNSADFNAYRITIENKDRKHSVIRTNFSIDGRLSTLIQLITNYSQNNPFKR